MFSRRKRFITPGILLCKISFSEVCHGFVCQSHFAKEAYVLIVFRTLRADAYEQFSGEVVFIQTCHMPFFPVFREIAADGGAVGRQTHIHIRTGNSLMVVVVGSANGSD